MMYKVRDEQDMKAALNRIDELWGADKESPEGEELEHLITIVDRYETQSLPDEYANPIEAILYRMEEQGLQRADLEPFIGSKGRVSEILNGKRSLTLDMIRRLHRGLKIPLELLVFSAEYSDSPESMNNDSVAAGRRANPT